MTIHSASMLGQDVDLLNIRNVEKAWKKRVGELGRASVWKKRVVEKTKVA